MPKSLTLSSLRADLNYVQQMLAGSEERTTGWAMWRNRARALEIEINEVAQQESNTASVALLFDGDPVIGSHEIRLDFATKALQDYQELISVAFSDQAYAGGISSKGPLRGKERSRLYIRELAHGSFGFVLEEAVSNQSEALPTPLKSSVEFINKTIKSLLDRGDDKFSGINPRMLKSLKKWANTLTDHRSSIKISDDKEQIVVSCDNVREIARSLDSFDVVEEVVAVSGALDGFLPTRGTFEFRSNDGVLSGNVSDEFADTLACRQADYLHKNSVASVRFVKTIRNGLEERQQRVLEGIELQKAPEDRAS